ncbi:MAG: HEAT repeat domain-containing protein [Bacteroidota bacterium]
MKEEKLLDYLDGTLSAKERTQLEQQLQNDATLRARLVEMQELQNWMESTPNLPTRKRLDDQFYQMLEAEASTNIQEARVIPLRRRFAKQWQIAAGFLLLFSLLTGVLVMNNQQHKQEMAMMQQTLEQNQQMMFHLLEGESPSARIKAVNFSTQTPQTANTATFEVLAKVLNTDDNLNVRLAALDALTQFADSKEVRKILIEALAQQNEPITQIALIQALVQLEEKEVVPKLQELINHPNLEKPVKDEAYNGLIQLGEAI